MAAWQQAVAVVAALAVGGGLAYGTYSLVRDTVLAEPSSSPSATASPEPSASSDPCDWGALPEEARPALAEQPDGLPEAYALTADVWACADETWSVEVEVVEGDGYPMGIQWQSLYLRSPSGDRVLLYGLRNDVQIEVVGQDVPARAAWLARVTGGDSFQVVQMDLADGLVVEDWGGGMLPASQVHDGGVWDVWAAQPLDSGAELWLGARYTGDASAVFMRTAGRTFQQYSAQRIIDQMTANGSITASGIGGVVLWVSSDLTYAIGLEQVPAGDDGITTTGSATWVVIDLVRDQWRLESSSAPTGVCAPEPEAALGGTYDAPGPIPAVCATGGSGSEAWTLAVDAGPVLAG
ncbi:hypothetical protein [Demequina lignilytica]|uniref:Uncharacterized protein n=1 Tax=Demequina lignilytica TaxID=3051663 RepID=A0AB35MHX5_9MICO|nr:hypothetical protein [Demequina sp. SYSU T0a273]MDN4483347.1 hypothetical protein [Demequina sp. SYSU T0a273]